MARCATARSPSSVTSGSSAGATAGSLTGGPTSDGYWRTTRNPRSVRWIGTARYSSWRVVCTATVITRSRRASGWSWIAVLHSTCWRPWGGTCSPPSPSSEPERNGATWRWCGSGSRASHVRYARAKACANPCAVMSRASVAGAAAAVIGAVRGATVALTPTAASTSRAPIAIRDGTRARRRVVRAGRTVRGSLRLGAAGASAGACPLAEPVSVSIAVLAQRCVGRANNRSSLRPRGVARRCRRRLYDEGGPRRRRRLDRDRADRRRVMASADREGDSRCAGERGNRRQRAPPAPRRPRLPRGHELEALYVNRPQVARLDAERFLVDRDRGGRREDSDPTHE